MNGKNHAKKSGKKINSRQKGASGEREWAKYLTARGFPAYRGRQFSGRDDAPDVCCETLGNIHWEVKRCQHLNLPDALSQARNDSGAKCPIVAHRRNGEDWQVTLSAESFFTHIIPCFVDEKEAITQTAEEILEKALCKE